MIKIGLLGAAQVTPYSIIAPVSLRDDCEITVIACRDAERGAAFAQKHGIPNVETDYKALICREDIDLVYNALPPSHHAALSIAALYAGKAVLCEKPFALNASEARRMVEASINTGRPLIEAFHYRYHPAFKHVLKIIQAGGIGQITHMEAIFVAPVPYRKDDLRHTLSIGGGTLMDMGCYPVHWCRTIFGSEPKIISAEAISNHPNIDLTTRAKLSFSGSATAKIECSMAAEKPFKAEFTVWGKSGRLQMIDPIQPHIAHLITVDSGGITTTEIIAGNTTYDHQLEYVLDVLAGRVRPLTGGADAIANMFAIDRIYETAGLRPRGY